MVVGKEETLFLLHIKTKSMSNTFRNNKGELVIGHAHANALVKKFGTPLYVYHGEGFIKNYKLFEKSLKSLNVKIHYSVKSNSSLALLSLLSKEGAGADIVSIGEMQRALKAGIKPSDIVFSGVGKTEDELIEAISKEIGQINAESSFEVDKIIELSNRLQKKTRVALRVNLNIDANTHKKISTGKKENKFGIPIDNKIAEKLYKKISSSKNIIPSGLAIHIGSQLQNLDPFKNAYLTILKFADYLSSKGYDVPILDLGGGLGINYEKILDPDFFEYGNLVKKIFSKTKYKLCFEPGRSISANNGILLTKVINVKKTKEKRFIIVDSAMNDLIRPTLYNAFHVIEPIYKNYYNIGPADIVGPICETGDFFAEDRMMPNVKENDILAIFSTGAYGASMMSNYNSRPEASEILIYKKKSYVIRPRRNINELLSNELNPFVKD